MLDITAADGWTSEALWTLYAARRALTDAIAAAESAGAALLPLIGATEWQADGVRALHELIVALRARTAAEIGELNTRMWEIDAAAAS
ncbi:hypothetical protein HD600_001149 [Microbacterium ginsengiterrae]|uniref:Uncharacterized protein n=1 Tax=Microbacterium ginsengiterrae TaxID=546115 RepID=A0A7W9CCB6_9MICO|nr:hypothetical protein [Microbacterium ginsengiterrae]MBB5742652.1 hypothetical protein [Microbacterium ginsengiterrae]